MWTGAANGNYLSAISFIVTGDAGGDTYQPFLFDLGAGVYTSGSNQFNPSTQIDLFSADDSITMRSLGSTNFVELDLSGADEVALQTGDNYAFCLLSTSASAPLTFERSYGTQSDPNGDGFTFTSFSDANDYAQPYSDSGVRNDFIGVYTVTSVPEPTSLALLSGALIALGLIRRLK